MTFDTYRMCCRIDNLYDGSQNDTLFFKIKIESVLLQTAELKSVKCEHRTQQPSGKWNSQPNPISTSNNKIEAKTKTHKHLHYTLVDCVLKHLENLPARNVCSLFSSAQAFINVKWSYRRSI